MLTFLTMALWGGIHAGMTRDQVAVAQPATVSNSWVRITPDCPAKVKVHYRGGLVASVELRGKPALADRCANQLRLEALARYGRPIDRELLPSIGWRYGLRDDALRWAQDGVLVTFKRLESGTMGDPSWTMEFQPMEANL